ncbi:MAG: T9SS type A sorting domain-containing protein [Saprospiraceae bacterium]|nr:T9SS type A sorting domain-containing protein [Saprospiraceae bacterium]
MAVINGNTTFCNGKSSTLTASGGINYLWSTGSTSSSIMINPSLTTTYSVTVTDSNGCTSSASRMASVMNVPTAVIVGDKKICSGDVAVLTSSGGVVYLWSTGQTSSEISVSPSSSTLYKVTVTDVSGCSATSVHGVIVNAKPQVTISGNDKFCQGDNTKLKANVSGTTFCEKDCKDELLLKWTLDQCNAEGLANQLSYSEFVSTDVAKGGLWSVSSTIASRNRGDHSCTFDGNGGTAICFSAMESCDPNQYNPINALRFSITLKPNEVGKLSKLTFREQSPLNWITTNGSTGINNYNQKYLIRVFKDGNLIFSQNDLITERTWNTETFDFSDNPEFRITAQADFTFELYGYCTVDRGGIPGWEIDDIKIFGGECSSSPSIDNITYLWSTGETTSEITVTPGSTSTYSVTISDCNHCSASDDILITVYPLPTPGISGNNIMCTGSSTTLTANGGTSYIWSNGSNTASVTVSPTTTSNYTVTVTDANGCKASTGITVTVNPLPTPGISGNNIICTGSSTTLTANGGTSYIWSNGSNTASATVSPTTTSNYTVTVTDANGCKASTGITVTVNPLPTPGISGNNIICTGSSTTLTANGGTSYIWSNGSNTASVTVSPTTTSNYTVTVTDANGCKASTDITVTVNPLPTPGISGNNIICTGSSTTLIANGGTSYIWSNGSNTASVTVSPTTTSNYTVTVTDANGCKASTGITVTVNPLPTPGISGNNIICTGSSTTLTANGGTSYIWSNGSNTASVTVSPTTTSNYTVTVTDANGCKASTGITVTVNPLPTPGISGNNIICTGSSTTLTANGGTSYIWSNGSNTASVTVSPTTTSNYTVTVTDANGCKASTGITVTVNPLPTPGISGNNIICTGSSTTLTANGGTSYIWSNGSNTASATVSPTTTSNYTVTVTDANGCKASTGITVTVNPLPTPGISGNNIICTGSSTTLTANGGTSYLWSNGSNTASATVSPTTTSNYTVTVTDANGCKASTGITVTVNPLPTPGISGNNIICTGSSTTLTANGGTSYIWSNGSNTASATVSPTTTSNYTVTVTDANGCKASTGITVTVNPLPTPGISGNNIICTGSSTTLTANGGTSYIWSNGSNTASATVSPTTTSNYTVTVTDANGCKASTGITVTVNPLPTPGISGNNIICTGSSTTLTANGGTSYIWSNGSNTASATVSPTTTSNYTVTVTDANGCKASTGITVTVNPLPKPVITGNKEICQNECTTLTASGGVQYAWSGVASNDFTCKGAFYIGGPQGGANQQLYTISDASVLSEVGNLGTNNVNGIAYYCQAGNSPFIYGMKMKGTSIEEAVKASFVKVDPRTAAVTILGEIPQPPNPYGPAGTTGIMAYIGEASKEGIYYFPAISTLINPSNFQIIDYTFYLGSIDLNNHGNGANVIYKPISILSTCKPYMDACIEGFKNFALDPSTQEPSGGIHDWALSPDGLTLYSFFGIENALFRLNLNTLTTSCLAAPLSNSIYTGQTGAKTDEFGGIYFRGNTLYGLQVDRGRLFSIDLTTGGLNLVSDSLPIDFRGDNATCYDCGMQGTSPINLSEINVCPQRTTTYYVKITDTNGCMASDSVTVVVNVKPQPIITGNNNICKGVSTTLQANGGVAYIWSNGSTTSSISISPNQTITYQVTVTDIKGCTGTASMTVKVNELPTPVILGNNNICFGQTASLFSSGGVSYSWSTGATSAFVNLSPSTTTKYSVTVTDANGCKASTDVTITVNPLPVPTISGNNIICIGGNTTLTAGGGVSYQWSGGGSEPTKVISSAGIYTVTVTSQSGCTASSSINVIQDTGIPDISASNDGPLTCSKTSVLLIALPSAGVSYSWSGGGTNQTKSVSNAGTYTVTITKISTGCTQITSTTVEQNISVPTVTTSNDGPLTCSKTSVTLTAIGGGPYSWSGGGSSSTKSVSGPGTYTVTVTSSNGCTASSSTTVEQNVSIPIVTTSNDGPLTCSKASVTLTATGGGSYSWSGGGNSATKSVSSPGTYTVTVTSSNGCTSTSSTTVQQNITTPTVNTTNDGPLTCAKTSVTLNATGGGTYLWNIGGTTASITASSPGTYTVTVTGSNGCTSTSATTVEQNITTPSISVTNDGPLSCSKTSVLLTATGGNSYSWSGGGSSSTKQVSTSGIYTVTVTSLNGCTASTSTSVSQSDVLPVVTTSNDGPLTCVKATVTLTATGGGSYLWSGGGSSATKPVSNPGTYTVTITSANGCTATSSTIVEQNITPPSLAITNDGPLTCIKTLVSVTASGGIVYSWNNGSTSSVIATNSKGTFSVTVTSSNGCTTTGSTIVDQNITHPTVSVTNDGILTCGTTTVTLTATGGGSYLWSGGGSASTKPVTNPGTYTVTVTSLNGCTATGSTVVDQNITPPKVTVSNDGTLTCLKTSVILTATGGGSYAWNNSGSLSTKTVNTPGLYTVTVTSANRCTSTGTTVVEQNIVPPVALISGNNKICEGGKTTLTASGGISYIWNTGQTLASIEVQPVNNSIYTVTVTNSIGCTSTATESVMIKPKPDILLSGLNKICKGDSAFIVATGFTQNECQGVCKIGQPSVLVSWNLNACQAVMNLGTHLDYSEFTPDVSKGNCTNVTAGIVHRLPGNKHSCTPGPHGDIAMCIGTQKSCNPAKLDYQQALRFEMTLTPDQVGQITGLEFYEQSPLNYQWVDGASGLNNFARKFLLRVSKNGEYIYYEDEKLTNRTWGIQKFNFESNDNFRTISPATYLFEIIPYCTINNGATESIWDIDEIKILGGCCSGSTKEISSYLWSNGQTGTSIKVKPTENTTYTVTVTDCCGCSNVKAYKVDVSCLMADLGPDRMINFGETVTLTPVITGKSICDDANPANNEVKYLWSNGATTSSITVTPNSSIFYRVTVVDCNDCYDTESISVILMLQRPITIYPNPAYDRVNLASEFEIEPELKIRILSSDGKTVVAAQPEIIFNTTSNVSIIIPDHVADGMYYMEINTGKEKFTEKLILIKK